jgi:hypothetical protein
MVLPGKIGCHTGNRDTDVSGDLWTKEKEWRHFHSNENAQNYKE